MNWFKHNWFKMGLLVCLLVVAFSVGYYLTIYLPERNNKNEADISAIRDVIAPSPERQNQMDESWEKMKQANDQRMAELYDCIKSTDVAMKAYAEPKKAECNRQYSDKSGQDQCYTKWVLSSSSEISKKYAEISSACQKRVNTKYGF